MIRVDHLSMRFGRTVAVDDVSLAVRAGEAVALWGTNGAGKSTILRCVLGLLRHRGTVSVGGNDVHRQGKLARRLVGYVPQELGFNDDVRVGAAVGFFARLKGVPVRSIDAVLARVGLQGHDRKRMRELSGGMKQRLALTMALLGDPPVLVLDEVTASLDACGREELMGVLCGLCSEGKSMLFASHRADEVTALAHRVIMLEKGRFVREAAGPGFWPRTSSESVLHLHLSEGVRGPAMALLRSNGFEPTMNGVGLLVPVVRDRKAVPFHLLAEARMTVDDFEMLEPPSAGGPARGKSEVAS